MANKDFNSLEALFAYVKNDISEVLKTDVYDVVKSELQNSIEPAVYQQYTSNAEEPYERREERGGLADITNIHYEEEDEETISIRNYTPAVSFPTQFLDSFIIYGNKYDWTESEIYQIQPYPRNFYGFTVDSLKNSLWHVYAMREGLKKKGYKIE